MSDAYSLTEVRVTRLKPVTFAYVSTRTTQPQIPNVAMDLCGKVEAGLKAGNIMAAGGMIFSYLQMSDAHTAFTLQIGAPVYDSAAIPPGLESRRLDSPKVAIALYTGSMQTIGKAWGEFVSRVRSAGHRPQGESRERYIYWEDPASANNITLLETVVQGEGT